MIDFEHRLTVVEDRSKSNTHRLDEVEKKQNDLSELVGTVKVLATKQKGIEDDVAEIKNDVKSLTVKPAKRWENLITQIISLVVAAVVGFVLAKIGL
jgi:seryl-tRNA synthetase